MKKFHLLLGLLLTYFKQWIKVLELHFQSVVKSNTIHTALLTVEPDIADAVFGWEKGEFREALLTKTSKYFRLSNVLTPK